MLAFQHPPSPLPYGASLNGLDARVARRSDRFWNTFVKRGEQRRGPRLRSQSVTSKSLDHILAGLKISLGFSATSALGAGNARKRARSR